MIWSFKGLPARCRTASSGEAATKSSAEMASTAESSTAAASADDGGDDDGERVGNDIFEVAVPATIAFLSEPALEGGGRCDDAVAFEGVGVSVAARAFGIVRLFVGEGIDLGGPAVVAQPHVVVDRADDFLGILLRGEEPVVFLFVELVHGVPAVLAFTFGVAQSVHASSDKQVGEQVEERENHRHDF